MSDSVRPHRWQPTRLPRPWDPPGKNTGVGCHFLLQGMKVKSKSEGAQSCPTLSDPMDCSLLGSSIQWIFQARVLEWGAIAFSQAAAYTIIYKYCVINVRTSEHRLLGTLVSLEEASWVPMEFQAERTARTKQWGKTQHGPFSPWQDFPSDWCRIELCQIPVGYNSLDGISWKGGLYSGLRGRVV